MSVASSEFGAPHPLSRKLVPPPRELKGEGTHSPAGEGVGESQFEQRVYSVVWYLLQGTLLCSTWLGGSRSPVMFVAVAILRWGQGFLSFSPLSLVDLNFIGFFFFF